MATLKPATKEDLKRLAQDFADKALRDPEAPSTVVLFLRPDGQIAVMPLSFSDDIEKEIAKQVIKAITVKENMQAGAMVSECWVSLKEDITEENLSDQPLPSQDPNRKEAMCLVFADSFGTWLKMDLIERDPQTNEACVVKPGTLQLIQSHHEAFFNDVFLRNESNGTVH